MKKRWSWPGVILLCLGILLVFQMQVTLHILYGFILSVPLFGGGVFCVVRGMRKSESHPRPELYKIHAREGSGEESGHCSHHKISRFLYHV
jgi:hypothetical protein